jgi:glycosyltransferase involved in cell wall biosynthesis
VLERGVPLEVLLVGRLVPMKGFSDALEAASRVTSRPVRVTLAGEGPERANLVARASELGVELRQVGSVSTNRLAEIMSRSHVQVQPSLTTTYVVEQFGRSVAEAMTVGLPCLVSDSGELPRVVGLDARAIFPEGDVGRLAGLLRGLAESPDQLEALALHQKSLARRWEVSEAARCVLGFWAEALR